MAYKYTQGRTEVELNNSDWDRFLAEIRQAIPGMNERWTPEKMADFFGEVPDEPMSAEQIDRMVRYATRQEGDADGLPQRG